MIHRATGQIMGPIAPIFAEAWPFHAIADSEILWRYVSLHFLGAEHYAKQ
jgi:hypothetical protein